MVLMSIAKAFDKVWHAGLLYKLQKMQIPSAFIRIIKTYLTNRTFNTQINGQLSTTKNIRAGVPQGSVLGPVLYNLYTADLRKTDNTHKAIFADDTADQSTKSSRTSKNT